MVSALIPGSSGPGSSPGRGHLNSHSALACEYSRLSFARATTCESRRVTSAIRGQKFYTDDVNLFRIVMGTNVAAGKPTETAVTEFCYKSVNCSLEELKNIKIIRFLIHELFR